MRVVIRPFYLPILVTLGLVGFAFLWSLRGLEGEGGLLGRLARSL